jgi:hypothetical protein
LLTELEVIEVLVEETSSTLEKLDELEGKTLTHEDKKITKVVVKT